MVQVNFNTWGNNGFISENFEPNQKTFVITHGYQNTGGNAKNNFKAETWIADMAQALREKNPQANIIVVDWEDGAKPQLTPIGGVQYYNYVIAANNTREVGTKIAEKLIQLKADPTQIELIGHSLGAHVSGFAGAEYQKKTQQKINRITGLDPAGPEFSTVKNVLKKVEIPIIESLPVLVKESVTKDDRLDPTDAGKVVAIHTSGTLGNKNNLGNFDVFVNKNYFFQPGATNFADNHGYATDLYTDLINGNSLPQKNGQQFNLNSLNNQSGRLEIDTRRAIFIGATSGQFSGGSNRLSLGTPAFESFVQFDGKPFITTTDQLFNLGQLTYRNGSTNFGSEPQGNLPFNINISLRNPLKISQSFRFLFNNVATLNETGNPVLDGDVLSFSGAGLSSDQFSALGTDYTLDLFGFSPDGGSTQIGKFNSPEKTTAYASLFGKISVAESRIIPPLLYDNARSNLAKARNAILSSRFFKLTEGPLAARGRSLSDSQEASLQKNLDTQPFVITEELATQYPGGVEGLEGNEQIFGSSINDVIRGIGGADFLAGSRGSDYIQGGEENDQVYGGKEDDVLNGNQNNDFVSGDIGNDIVRGGKNNDTLNGGDGNDILIGDLGADQLTGGKGEDIFVLRTDTGEEKTNPATADWILDFNPAENDRIGINGGVPLEVLNLQSIDINQDGTPDTVIQYLEENEVIGSYKNIFGVVINTSPTLVQSSLFSISVEEPVMALG